jgi:hypothetical protein
MRTPIRHGEVLLLPVNTTPVGISERVTSCIVEPSDSGHHHVLDGDREFWRIVDAKGTLYVDLDAPTRLWHQEDHDQRSELKWPQACGGWSASRSSTCVRRSIPTREPGSSAIDGLRRRSGGPRRSRPAARQPGGCSCSAMSPS